MIDEKMQIYGGGQTDEIEFLVHIRLVMQKIMCDVHYLLFSFLLLTLIRPVKQLVLLYIEKKVF